MQALTSGPRAGLTTAQVVAAYQADALTVGMGCELVTFDPTTGNLVVRADLSSDLSGGKVDRDNLATIHGSCTLSLSRELTWGADLLRPYMTLAGSTAGKVRWNLGVYVATSPDTTPGTTPMTWAVTGYDRLYFLARVIGDSWSVPAGSLVLDAARAVITAAGAGGQVLLDGTASGKTLAVDMVWTLDSSNQPTYLQVANDLLSTVSYRALWANEDGAYCSGPYVAASARGVEWAHTVQDARTSLVSTSRTQTLDTFDVPNLWRFIRNGLNAPPAATDGSDGLYQVVNQSSGPTSIDVRGYTKKKIAFVDATDQASLRALGDQTVATDRLRTRTLKVHTAPMPGVGHFDVYSYTDLALGGLLRVEAQSWSLPLTGENMTQTWLVVT